MTGQLMKFAFVLSQSWIVTHVTSYKCKLIETLFLISHHAQMEIQSTVFKKLPFERIISRSVRSRMKVARTRAPCEKGL